MIASLHRPLWPEKADATSMNSWEQLGEDVQDLLAEIEHPVASIGHSMGSATILMAAVNRPEYFKKIVLIEPVLVPLFATFILGALPGLARRVWPLARQTNKRVDSWVSRESVFQHFRPKKVFKRVSDEVLWDYVDAGTAINQLGHYELIFTKEWELQCYLKVYNCWDLFKSLKIPALVIRGSESNTLSKNAWNMLRKISPQNKYIEIADSGHLVPFEQPEFLASTIIDWIEN